MCNKHSSIRLCLCYHHPVKWVIMNLIMTDQRFQRHYMPVGSILYPIFLHNSDSFEPPIQILSGLDIYLIAVSQTDAVL